MPRSSFQKQLRKRNLLRLQYHLLVTCLLLSPINHSRLLKRFTLCSLSVRPTTPTLTAMAQTTRFVMQGDRRGSIAPDIASCNLLVAMASQCAPTASFKCLRPPPPTTSPTSSERRRKRRGNKGTRVQRRLVQPSDTSAWWYKSQKNFARMSAKTQRQWHHITHIEGTDAGRDADVQCTECQRRGVVCRIYTETATAAGDNLGRACSRCREIQKKPCSFVQKRRALDSGDSRSLCDSSASEFVLREQLDAALARIDVLQAEVKKLENKQ
jgi:hypothetical protein